MFHKNRLLEDDSHEISYLIFFRKIGKDVSKFVVCCSCDWRSKCLEGNLIRKTKYAVEKIPNTPYRYVCVIYCTSFHLMSHARVRKFSKRGPTLTISSFFSEGIQIPLKKAIIDRPA